jgi:hypothetical protein
MGCTSGGGGRAAGLDRGCVSPAVCVPRAPPRPLLCARLCLQGEMRWADGTVHTGRWSRGVLVGFAAGGTFEQSLCVGL